MKAHRLSKAYLIKKFIREEVSRVDIFRKRRISLYGNSINLYDIVEDIDTIIKLDKLAVPYYSNIVSKPFELLEVTKASMPIRNRKIETS